MIKKKQFCKSCNGRQNCTQVEINTYFYIPGWKEKNANMLADCVAIALSNFALCNYTSIDVLARKCHLKLTEKKFCCIGNVVTLV